MDLVIPPVPLRATGVGGASFVVYAFGIDDLRSEMGVHRDLVKNVSTKVRGLLTAC